jgi:hypothetical protein
VEKQQHGLVAIMAADEDPLVGAPDPQALERGDAALAADGWGPAANGDDGDGDDPRAEQQETGEGQEQVPESPGHGYSPRPWNYP